ncbi:MAG: HAD family hydrolase [Anaerolineae bacterium]
MLKAILFDLDDTLLDWSGFQLEWPHFERQFLQRVFDYVGKTAKPLPDLEAFVSEFHRRIFEAWRIGRGALVAPNIGAVMIETAEALGAPAGVLTVIGCLDAYEWGAVPGTKLFPEIPETLAFIREQGIKTAIVTNAAQPMIMRDREIQEHGLLEFFPECRISAADVGILKPHPAIFQHTLQQLGVTADEAVFVGDNPIADIAGAQGAGMQAVLRITRPVPPMLSGLIVPDAAVNGMDELPRILDEWFPDWRNN